MAAMAAAPAALAAETQLADRLRWLNGTAAPSEDDIHHAANAPARSCLKGVAHNRTMSWKCCPGCCYGVLSESAVLMDEDFSDCNAWRAAACCGSGSAAMGGCWAHVAGVRTIIDYVSTMNQKHILQTGHPYSNEQMRNLSYQRWSTTYQPHTPASGPGQLPIPVCVVATFRSAFQEPLGVVYAGRGT